MRDNKKIKYLDKPPLLASFAKSMFGEKNIKIINPEPEALKKQLSNLNLPDQILFVNLLDVICLQIKTSKSLNHQDKNNLSLPNFVIACGTSIFDQNNTNIHSNHSNLLAIKNETTQNPIKNKFSTLEENWPLLRENLARQH